MPSGQNFSVLTVSKRHGWEDRATEQVAAQTIPCLDKWVVVQEGLNAPKKIRASNLNRSLNYGLQQIDTDYVIFYQDFIDIPKDCFEKLLSLVDEKTFVTTSTIDADGCFTAGTGVLTPNGYRPIESIKTGDKVMTPYGIDTVVRGEWMTGVKPTYDYGLFTCTKKHKIITDRGIVPIDDLRYTDHIWQNQAQNQDSTEKSFTFLEYLITATLSPRTELTDFIFNGLLQKTLEARLAHYTGQYGNTITEQYQRAIKSIIKTDMMTTRLKALNSLLRQNMLKDIFGDEMREREKVLGRLRLYLSTGMELLREESGTRKEEKLTGLINSTIGKDVYNAILNTVHDSLELVSSVAITAKPQHLGNAEVWNLETSSGMYIANGVLVSNSNDARYTGADDVHRIRPEFWEANVAIAPMKVIRELGGFEEELDNGWAYDNVHIAQRAAMLGCRFLIDETNRPQLLEHELTSKLKLELNDHRCATDIAQIRAGKKPLRLKYL